MQRASETLGVRLGRYLYHQLDYDFVREADDPNRRFDDANRTTPVWWARDGTRRTSLWEAQEASVCPEALYYCGCDGERPPNLCTRNS